MGKSVAITGRRPESLPWRENEYNEKAIALKNKLKYDLSSLIDKGYTEFYVGMARGIDTYVAEILCEFRDTIYPNIKIFACIPYKGFADNWDRFDRERFYRLLCLAEEVKEFSDEYNKSAIFERNKYMVDNADLVFAVYDNIENGGTYNTLMYAKSISKDIMIEEI